MRAESRTNGPAVLWTNGAWSPSGGADKPKQLAALNRAAAKPVAALIH